MLTDKQRDVLQYIIDFTMENGYQPSIPEMCLHFGFKSTNAITSHLRLIEKKGYIDRQGKKGRSIKILNRKLH